MIVVVADGPVAARVVEAVGDGVPVSLAEHTGGNDLRPFTRTVVVASGWW